MKQIEQTMGSFRAAGQLQQRPAAAEGELLKRSWWQFFPPEYLNEDQIGGLPRFPRIVSSWDTAFEGKTSSDYVVGQIWGLQGPDRYLLWGYRRQANLTRDHASDAGRARMGTASAGPASRTTLWSRSRPTAPRSSALSNAKSAA